MPNCITSGNLVLQLYPDFGDISNLKLNLPKTVLIALWPCILKQMRSTLLRDTFPEWSSAKLDTWSRYLGFAVGLGRESHFWDKAIDKYVERSDLWSGFSLGLHVAAQIYNCFVITVFSFFWQLEHPPASVVDAEGKALRKFTPGPGERRIVTDLFCLQQHFGQTRSFHSICHSSFAAKLRVFMLEDLEINEKVSALAEARCKAYRFDLVVLWRTWYDSSYVSVLHQSAQRAASLGMDINRTWFKLLRGHQLPVVFDVYRRAKST